MTALVDLPIKSIEADQSQGAAAALNSHKNGVV
jgi:hypothetical protein